MNRYFLSEISDYNLSLQPQWKLGCTWFTCMFVAKFQACKSVLHVTLSPGHCLNLKKKWFQKNFSPRCLNLFWTTGLAIFHNVHVHYIYFITKNLFYCYILYAMLHFIPWVFFSLSCWFCIVHFVILLPIEGAHQESLVPSHYLPWWGSWHPHREWHSPNRPRGKHESGFFFLRHTHLVLKVCRWHGGMVMYTYPVQHNYWQCDASTVRCI